MAVTVEAGSPSTNWTKPSRQGIPAHSFPESAEPLPWRAYPDLGDRPHSSSIYEIRRPSSWD